MKRIIACCFLALVMCFALTACGNEDPEKTAAIESFDSAKETVEARNADLESAISDAENLLAEGSTPLDESLIPALETAISDAKAAEVDIPAVPDSTEDINSATQELEAADTTSVLSNLSTAYLDLQKSIEQYDLVDAPSESYVVQCLHNVPHVKNISAVTEDNDPNGNLNKAGGYTAQVYFSSNQVDQSSVYGKTIIEKGTDCGGSVEVYANEEDAQNRDQYLSAFDGGVLASGSHTVVGTVVVRTSSKLTASQQKKMEKNIINALTTVN